VGLLILLHSRQKAWFTREFVQRGGAAKIGQREHAGGGRPKVRSKAVGVVMGDDATVLGFTPELGKRPGLLEVGGAASRDATTQTVGQEVKGGASAKGRAPAQAMREL
jgi:hypothetical protein